MLFGKFIVICMLANKDDGPTVPVADLGHIATEFTWQFESPERFVFCSNETVFAKTVEGITTKFVDEIKKSIPNIRRN